jgi:hypothetical protein
MNSKGKRLKKTVLAIPPAAPATVAVVPVGAPPLGRPARRRGMRAIAEARMESAVIVETGIGIDGETVGAEVTIGSGVTAAVVGIDDTVVSHEVKTGVVRIVCTIGVLHFSLGIGMDAVRVLRSERRAQSGSQLII